MCMCNVDDDDKRRICVHVVDVTTHRLDGNTLISLLSHFPRNFPIFFCTLIVDCVWCV